MHDSWEPPSDAYNDGFLGKVEEIGFDGLEIGFQFLNSFDSSAELKGFGKRLSDAGTCGKERWLSQRRAGSCRQRQQAFPDDRRRGVTWCGCGNGALSSPRRLLNGRNFSPGWPSSQDASRDAMIYDYERLADELRKAADAAAPHGADISVEVHQNSLADDSWSGRLIHKLVDRPNFGVNPDLGNVLWTYDEPEEPTEMTIVALAPVSVCWRCKNLHRVNHPENERSVFIRVPLLDREIDYRFTISAMLDANYCGYLAIEGFTSSDQFYQDRKSLNYTKSIVEELGG